MSLELSTGGGLRLFPLPPAAATALPGDREAAAAAIGMPLAREWPLPELLDILPMHADLEDEQLRWGVWVIADAAAGLVIGDIGFFGPPAIDGSVEIGYAIAPDRRRRGHASDAASALAGWALDQPGITAVLARCEPGNSGSVGTLRRAGFAQTRQAEDGMIHWRRLP